MLEHLQLSKDAEEQAVLHGVPSMKLAPSAMEMEVEDEDKEDLETDEPDAIGNFGYLGKMATEQFSNCAEPQQDVLNNHYVRIVHLNGIHHLALVTCSCQGADTVHADLVHCHLVPATFS